MTQRSEGEMAERAVACAVLLDNVAAMKQVGNTCKAEDFADELCRAVFFFGRKMVGAEGGFDPVILMDAIRSTPRVLLRVGEANLPERIADLLSGSTEIMAWNIKGYAGIVARNGERRRAMAVGQTLLTALSDPAVEVPRAVQLAISDLLAASTHRLTGGYKPLDPVGVLTAIEERATVRRGILAGYDLIDNHFRGFRPGELIIIGGGAKSGKTTLTLNIARHAAHTGRTVGFVSCEMTQEQLTERLLNAEGMVGVDVTSRGLFTPEEATTLLKASERLSGLPLYVDDAAMPSIEDVRLRALELKAQHPDLAMIVVDFLQLVTTGRQQKQEREELTYIAYALKALAKECQCVVLAPCQLNYKQVDGEKREPEARDLQGSSGMAQAGDAIFLVWRSPFTPFGGGPPAEAFNIKCALSRRTAPFTGALAWRGKYMRVENRGPGGPE